MTAARARSLPPALAVLTVYAVAAVILRSAVLGRAPMMISAALAFDLTVTAPAAVWWLGVRRAGWPSWTVGLAFSIGLLAGRMLLPGTVVVTTLVALWGMVELAVIAMAIGRIRTIVRVARGDHGPGPVAGLEAGLRAARVPGRAATIVASELVAVALGLGGWFRRAPADGFSMHRRKSWSAVVGVLVFLIAGESLAVHVVLAHWSVTAAWIATALSIYSVLWLLADLHAVRLYPLRVTDDAIVVSVGLRWRMTIPRDAIVGVALADAAPAGALNARVLEPTVVITLDREIEAQGLLGIRRHASVIALTVDEAETFVALFAAAGDAREPRPR